MSFGRAPGRHVEQSDKEARWPCPRSSTSIFHTYSTFGRGQEWLGGSYAWLDLTALGRQEEWEEPKGRADDARSASPDFAS
jgi:predicted dithiol-disulfide oxidoreductase (DUF899 family)